MNTFKRQLIPPRTRHNPGQMNGLEGDYALYLRLRKHAGEVLAYEFEALTFVLTHMNGGLRFTPDFLVVFPTHFELHEVKGHWEEDARVKMKAFAERYRWFKWVAVTREPKKLGGNWKQEVFGE